MDSIANSSSEYLAEKNRIDKILKIEDDDVHGEQDICRVCRIVNQGELLFHPCLCTGSIKYVHQDCLLQWLKYSKKDVCELCNHKFSFKPLYREDMPERLLDICVHFFRLLLTYCIVAICWGILVPLLSYRIFRMVFSGLVTSFLTFKFLNLFSTENLIWDIGKGSGIVAVFLATFISVVWLREQIMIGAPPDFLNLILPEPPTILEPLENQTLMVNELNPNNIQQAEQELHNILQEPSTSFSNNQLTTDKESIEGSSQEHNLSNEIVDIQPYINIEEVQEIPPARGGMVGEAERIVDDFTWQRLLGLDGTFAFIEHVFWTISLNIVFDIVFLYWPSQIGYFYISLMGYFGKITYFELPITIITGYFLVFISSIIAHYFTKWFHFRSLYNVSAIIYLMLKVFLLIFVEVGLFPVCCGATLDSRIKYFETFPACSVFLHWLAGMIYVFYSASFILVLRELLRPGMIQQPLTRHFRRLVASTTLFFTIILIVVYTPLRLIRFFLPMVLPYRFNISASTPELSLELILLQVILPSILEYSKAFNILKKLVRIWCSFIGGWLKLDRYLLPAKRQKIKKQQPNELNLRQNLLDPNLPQGVYADEEILNNNEEADLLNTDFEQDSDDELLFNNHAQAPNRWQPQQPAHVNNNNLAARHQALLMFREPVNYEQYERPDNFAVRIIALLFCLSITAIIIACTIFVIPVITGRTIFYLCGLQQPINDIYTFGFGVYFFWIITRLWIISRAWISRGWNNIKKIFHNTVWLLVRIFSGAIPFIVVIPLMLGIYFQLFIVGPLRVSINQTAIYFTWKEWAMGVIHFKIFCASVLMGPEDFWLKAAFEEVYNNGLRGFQLKTFYIHLIIPIINIISFQLCVPYIAAKYYVDLKQEEVIVLIRYSYPFTLSLVLVFAFITWQWKKLKSLANKIRNDRYLIGTQLVNFYRDNVTQKKQYSDNNFKNK